MELLENRRASRRLSLAALASAAFFTISAPAVAQEAEERRGQEDETEQHGEIVVLGTRTARDATLSSDRVTERMSQSSRSLERDILDAAGTYRLSDALELVSGISQQNNRGGFLDNFAIRGFLGTPDGGAEYYVDGFLANRGMAPPRDPATVERIEVLKGPAGALFGEIDPGGRVNIVTKTPRFTPGASATLTYGSFDTRRGELDVTGPITDTLAARMVVAAENSDGYRDFAGLRRRVVSPSLTWQPSNDLRLTYVAQHMIFDAPFDRGVPAIDGNPLALPASRFLGEPSNGNTRARDTRHQLTGELRLSERWSLNGGIAYRTGTLRGFSADQSRLVGSALWRQYRERGYEVEDLSARLELRGHFEALGTHHPSFGIKGYTLDYLELLNRRNPTAANPYAVDVFAPVYGIARPLPLLPSIDQRETRRVLTLYAQDMWDVTDRLTLVGGLRFDTYRQQLQKNLTGARSMTSDEPVKFRVGARYVVDDHVAVHANWGESFLLNSGSGRDGAAFAPEQGKGYEIGAAGRWDGMDLGITWFDIQKRGILTNDPVDAGFLAPVGQLTSRGVELDASWKLTRRWQVVANYSWVDAKADDAAFATPAVLNVPEHAGTLLVVHRLPVRGREWQLSGGLAYVGDRAGAVDASGLTLPDYLKVKAAIDAPLGEALTLRAEVDNLFDEHYAQSSYSPLWIYPGAPRTVRVSLRLRL
ncbi:TonB-dependent siderophore receptor [Sphingomonas xinjiangensis]|uniref:Iron complex outermembrane receptor protein n=1 Tax=Sphingomonas xinjiangensis TaxID=643568 RepID=A0A840YPL5_9SPHN|nr:TonB-dependent siderophore receptor [Sphingomonas xinjiangensis]MBB5710221.1 iron complex outermembrane receptor protein [Sphingomonas xinjiangensis]